MLFSYSIKTKTNGPGAAASPLHGQYRVVDLTQKLSPQMARWPETEPVSFQSLAEVASDGVYERRITVLEHVGTHVDAPAHFAEQGKTVEVIPPDSLIRPATVMDLRELCGDDPSFALEADHLLRQERKQGISFASEEFALFRTDWDRFANDQERYVGPPSGPPRFPGLAPSSAKLLVERGVVGIGIDTLGVEPGGATDYPLHKITLPAGLFHVEGLCNLCALPKEGALLICAPLPLEHGSGAPARVLALVPADA